MKAVILARVSTQKQEEEGHSLPAQTKRLQDYANKKGFEVVKNFSFSESAGDKIRKKFLEVVGYLKDNKDVRVLLCENVDRATRNFKDAVDLDEMRRKEGLEIHFVQDGFFLNKDASGKDMFMWEAKVFIAKQYLNRLSDDVKRTNEQKILNGEWITKPKIGYMGVYGENGKRTDIIPDPIRDKCITEIFEMYATGTSSVKNIQQVMENSGLKNNNKTGKPLFKSQIYSVLKDPFYYGEMKIKDRLYPHKYQPLISRELFDQVQNVMSGYNKKPFRYACKPFAFRGLIRCADCGCIITADRKKNKYNYYSCTNGKRKHAKRLYIPEEKLFDQLNDTLHSIELPEDKIKRLITLLETTDEAKEKFMTASMETLRAEWDKYEKRKSSLLDKLADEDISPEDYRKKLDEYDTKQNLIEAQIASHRKADKEFYITVALILRLAQRAYILFQSSEPMEKRALLNFLLRNCTLTGKKLNFTLKKPFAAVVAANGSSNLLRG